VFFAAIVLFPLSQATLSFARANHLEGNWAIGIELGIITFIIIVIATFFAWKIWSAPARRRLYLNLLILTVGIPAAIVFGVATTRLYS
jgi:hypothetical protein